MAWRPGDRVLQPLYGVGDVIDVGADRVTVAFDDGQVRKFVTSIVHLMPSDAPRPLMKLKNTLRHTRGEALITHLGREYYD